MSLPETRYPEIYAQAAVSTNTHKPAGSSFRSFQVGAADLHTIKKRDWSKGVEEKKYRLCCTGTPVLDLSDQPTAAVSVVRALSFLPKDPMEQLDPKVLASADVFAAALAKKGL